DRAVRGRGFNAPEVGLARRELSLGRKYVGLVRAHVNAVEDARVVDVAVDEVLGVGAFGRVAGEQAIAARIDAEIDLADVALPARIPGKGRPRRDQALADRGDQAQVVIERGQPLHRAARRDRGARARHRIGWHAEGELAAREGKRGERVETLAVAIQQRVSGVDVNRRIEVVDRVYLQERGQPAVSQR